MNEPTALTGRDASSEGQADEGKGPRRWRRLASYVLGAALAVALAAGAFWLTTAVVTGSVSGHRAANASAAAQATPGADTTPKAQIASIWERPAVSESGLADASGVRIAQVALTGGGGLIDLRFQVLNEQKAAAIHDAGHPPAVVQAATGLVVNSLLMGHSHSDPFHAGQTYYLVFENPGNLVQPGDKVSVLLGNAEVDGITIQ